MGSNTTTSTGSTRRNVVKGAAWSVPLMAVGAPAAHAGISQCEVTGSIQVGPMEFVDIRAVCQDEDQEANPASIFEDYGRGYLPRYLEICNCTNSDKWYRWQEVDDLSLFQIEVDHVHNDQNGPGQGWRPSFQLPKYGDVGGCKKFDLTYRTSHSLPYSSNTNALPGGGDREMVDIEFVLESGPSSIGPWTHEASLTVGGGAVWRTVREWHSHYGGHWADPVDFGSCGTQSAATNARSAAPSEANSLADGSAEVDPEPAGGSGD